MVLFAGCSRCGDPRWRQRQALTRQALRRSGSLPRGSGDGRRAELPRAGAQEVGDGIAPGQPRGLIEIEVSGARIRVEPGVDMTTLTTVLSALRGNR
jgi:hypothetical protein